MDETVLIQIQDLSGNWTTIQTLPLNDDRRVKLTLDTTSQMFKRRTRAITKHGGIIDIRN